MYDVTKHAIRSRLRATLAFGFPSSSSFCLLITAVSPANDEKRVDVVVGLDTVVEEIVVGLKVGSCFVSCTLGLGVLMQDRQRRLGSL